MDVIRISFSLCPKPLWLKLKLQLNKLGRAKKRKCWQLETRTYQFIFLTSLRFPFRALADILRQQGPVPISQYEHENIAALDGSPKDETPVRTLKNHYTPVHTKAANHGRWHCSAFIGINKSDCKIECVCEGQITGFMCSSHRTSIYKSSFTMLWRAGVKRRKQRPPLIWLICHSVLWLASSETDPFSWVAL